MSPTMILVRSMALLGAAVFTTACVAGQTPKADPCVKVLADGQAILRQNVDSAITGQAIARHVTSHSDCYDSTTVASAQTALVQLDQKPLPTPTWAQPPDWYNSIPD